MNRAEIIDNARLFTRRSLGDSNHLSVFETQMWIRWTMADFAIKHAAAETERADKAEAELREIREWVNGLESARFDSHGCLTTYLANEKEIWFVEPTSDLTTDFKTPYEAIQAYLKGGKRC